MTPTPQTNESDCGKLNFEYFTCRVWDQWHSTRPNFKYFTSMCGTNDTPQEQKLHFFCDFSPNIHIKSPKFLHFLIKIRNSLWDPCHTTSEILNILYLRVGPMTHHSTIFLNCRACVWDPCHTTQAPIGLCGRFVWCVWHQKWLIFVSYNTLLFPNIGVMSFGSLKLLKNEIQIFDHHRDFVSIILLYFGLSI